MTEYIVPHCYEDAVESLLLYIKYDLPVLLTGAVGCGKSSLLRHIARLAGRHKVPDLVTVQLCKDLDGRALLGAYHCTDVGGEFKWIPGLLTSAVLNSSWLILEDLDNAAVDALSILLPLIQSRTLQVPELGKTLQAGTGFRLFATLRTHEARNVQSHRVDMVLVSHFKRLHLDQIPTGDILTVSTSLFPKLSLILPRLIQVLEVTCRPDLCDDPQVRRVLLSRLISPRDFFKICRRLSIYVTTSSMNEIESIFLDLFTSFCAFVSDVGVRMKLARMLGSILGLANSDVDYYVQNRKPEISQRDDVLKIGRIELSNQRMASATPDEGVARTTSAVSLHPSVLRLVENLASCIVNNEAALLVGETGTGKTTIIQYLADRLGRKLHVINLSHQAETSDLFGGYKPVEFRSQMYPLMETFLSLFATTFSLRGNESFLTNCQTAFGEKNWKTLVAGMRHIADSAEKRFKKADPADTSRMLQKHQWHAFGQSLAVVEKQLLLHQRSLIFAFLEGTLVKSFRVGDWVLLDEINLATPELLAGLHSFIDSTCQSFVLTDRGDTEDIERHSDFRLFACMNPATDVGKRELPADVRSRFTEMYCDELTDLQEIHQVVLSYLEPLGLRSQDEGSSSSVVERVPSVTETVAQLHVELKALAEKSLMDGVNHKPHYSLRTFTQALRYAAKNPMGNVRRSLYEGFSLSYLTQLNRQSQNLVKSTIASRLLPSTDMTVKFKSAPKPQSGKFVQIEGYYVECGKLEPELDDKYIMTDTVKSNLAEIARAVSAGRIPVLLQGETSIGKTSLITWLAKASGNRCVRINNHEFTDLQDYIGSYQTNEAGKLVFVEGVLVSAVRKGFWIILDELNLAPSDVLEALNRLLDSNREIFIPEKQEVVKAHPQFMLFATQNPPGYYGGRKTLSRAFRNRFIEMHFDEIPPVELQTILQKRCALPPTYAKKIIDVMIELQARRKVSGIFAGKQGFITLRDLFRWAERYRLSEIPADGAFYDWSQHLADHGFLLLGGRVRKSEELTDIRLTLEKHFKRTVDVAALYGTSQTPSTSSTPSAPSLTSGKTIESFMNCQDATFSHIVWTSNLRRMVALAGTALAYGEPVLLVGETGCGKTTVSQIYACLKQSKLFAIGCHMNTETSDFLGGLRPARPEDKDVKGLFVWKDGPLVQAMEEGGVLLLDEISLAADSVLERVNSVLEPERQLVLTEKGCADADAVPLITAVPEFRLVATMNPGGDFGKKELSPALRNRFTEIWCDNLDILHDLGPLLEHNLFQGTQFADNTAVKSLFQRAMGEFVNWFVRQYPRLSITGRDVMSWISFINRYLTQTEDAIVYALLRHPWLAYFHGTSMVFESMTVHIKETGLGQTASLVVQFLEGQMSESVFASVGGDLSLISMDLVVDGRQFGVRPFIMARRDGAVDDAVYDFGSVSVRRSLLRILRGLMVAKGILLEGPPGVGKTSIVKALAAATGHKVVRINLSEQTDISELFGSDMPLESSDGSSLFAWRDGPFLDALKNGWWILLDELNLASQSVLEGLNACLDHRGEIFIPELNRSFKVDTRTTRIFACQNPLFQGSGRKGLPKSFLSRFTQVFVEELLDADLLSICKRAFPSLSPDTIAKLLAFNQAVQGLISQRKIGSDGQPWEFNLRDVMRWCELLKSEGGEEDEESEGSEEGEGGERRGSDQAVFLDLLYVSRFRSEEDRRVVAQLAVQMGLLAAGTALPRAFLKTEVTRDSFVVGRSLLPRMVARGDVVKQAGNLQLLQCQSGVLEKLAVCINHSFPVILVGPQGTAKSSVVQLLSAVTGNHLEVVSMNSDTDASDLLGGFEQNNWQRDVGNASRNVTELCDCASASEGPSTFLRECLMELSAALSSLDDAAPSRALLVLKRIGGRLQELDCHTVRVREVHQRAVMSCQRAVLGLESTRKGRFEWCDSVVVKALLEGSWLLIDNANLCSPAVLDRLNSVLEPNGELFVPERGDGDTAVIRAHPNFRLFMTTNPKYGELSRAMRNRGTEIFLPAILHDRDCLAVLTHLGLSFDVSLSIVKFVHSVAPLKALSLEDVQSLGKEVWMRLTENVSLPVALRKAVLHSSSFPEGCEDLIAASVQSLVASTVCPYPVTVRGLLQDRVLSNVARHENSLQTVVQATGNILQLVVSLYGLRQDGTTQNVWVENMHAVAGGLFLSRDSVEERSARQAVFSQFMKQIGMRCAAVDSQWMGRLDSCLLEGGAHLLPESRSSSFHGAWIRTCLSWMVASSCGDRGSDSRWVTSFDAEKVAEFLERFAVWIAEVLVSVQESVFPYELQTARKLMMASVWFRSLAAVLAGQMSSSSSGAAPIIWRLFTRHVLTFIDMHNRVPDSLKAQMTQFDVDFCLNEEAVRGKIRGALVDRTPFSTVEEFRVFNALLVDMTSEVVGLLSAEEVLNRLSDKAGHVVPFFGSGLTLRGGSALRNLTEDCRFWRLLQVEFINCDLVQRQLDSLIVSVIDHWSVFPVVLKELLLIVRKPQQTLTPLEMFSFRFELLENYQVAEDQGHSSKERQSTLELLNTSPDYLWWKEVLQLMSSKGNSWSAKLGNFQAQVSVSKRVECHLWRKLNAQSNFESVLEADRRLIAQYLLTKLRNIVPAAENMLTESDGEAEGFSSVLLWKRLLEGLPVVDGKVDHLEKDIFTADGSGEGNATRYSVEIAWILSGIVTMKALFPLFVDPVQAQQTTRDTLQYQAVECEASLRITSGYFTSLYGSGDEENYDEEMTLPYRQQLDFVKTELNKKEMHTVMYRPEPSMYHALVQDARNLRDLILRRVAGLLNADWRSDVSVGKAKVQEFTSAVMSLKGVAADLRRKYYPYQDMMAPFLSGVHQVLCGCGGLLRAVQRDLLQCEVQGVEGVGGSGLRGGSAVGGDLMGSLMTIFSVGDRDCLNYVQVAKSVWKQRKVLVGLYRARSEDRLLLEIRLIMLVLQLLRLHLSISRQTAQSVSLRNAVFMRFAVIWHDIEQVKKKAEEEKAQLYKFAADVDQQARETAFPSYQQDLDNLSVEMQALEIPSKTSAEHQRFFEQAQANIVKIHAEIVLRDGQTFFNVSPVTEKDVAGVVSLSLDVGCGIISSFPECCDFNMDPTGFLLHAWFQRRSVELADVTSIPSEKSGRNFYYDSNIGEVKRCLPVVMAVGHRVRELLEEWPSHPVLNEISLIVERLLTFHVTEPLAKLLMALELILEKCQHWEAKAHSGVSLQREMESVGGVVVEWRRMELAQWRHALDDVVRQKGEKGMRWWLLLFTTVMETVGAVGGVGDEKGGSLVALVKVVQKFVESSTMGEYRVRLELLRTVGLHFAKSRGSTEAARTRRICMVLQNLYVFYGQFIPVIETSIGDQRKPIEKELKNFVKVARWNDMNYWSLKHTIHKAHRTIHKHMRQLESVLDQVVVLKRPVSEAGPVPSAQTRPLPLGALPQLPSEECLPKMRNVVAYLRKSRRIVRQVLTSPVMEAQLEELNQTSGEFYERFKHLKEPSLSLPAEKRKDASKTLIKSKRLAFTDLTKSLKAIGLSARKGLALSSASATSIAAFEAPFSAESSTRLGQLPEKCQALYWQNVSNLAVFRRLLESPCKGLDSRFVALMKGFTEHLHHLILEQIQVASSLSHFSDSLQAHLASSVVETEECAVTGAVLRAFLVKGESVLRDVVVTLDRHLLLLDAAPKAEDVEVRQTEDVLNVMHGAGEGFYHGDAQWTALRDALSAFRQTVLVRLNAFMEGGEGREGKDGSLWVVGSAEWKKVRGVVEFFESVRGDLVRISELVLPVGRRCVVGLVERMDGFCREWAGSCLTPPLVEGVRKVKGSVERVMVECLKGFQNVMLYQKMLDEKSVEGSGERQTVNLNDGSLRSAHVALNTQKICRGVHVLVRQVNQGSLTTSVGECLQFVRCFLETYAVLAHSVEMFSFCLLESSSLLLGVLLTIFTDILENGFGKVEELEEPTNQENARETFEESEQAGLGEGDGAKDVSEQIESEDQLEDTKTPGLEKEENDTSEKIANEEHGIEMSEDFEGAMDDAPTEEEGSDDDEEKEEPEVDDQMGSLDGDQEDTTETLDKQFWEGEDEEEPDLQEDEADQEKKESAEGQGVDQKEKIDFAPKDEGIDESTQKENQDPVEEGEEMPENATEMEEESEEPAAEGPEFPEKMDVDDDDLTEENEVPAEDAVTEDPDETEETEETKETEENKGDETSTQQEEDSQTPELPEEETLKAASSAVPPIEKNEFDTGTDGVGMPAELDHDHNPDGEDQNNDDAYNSDVTGRSTAASGRKTNDETGRDVDSRLPQQSEQTKKEPLGVEKRSLEQTAEKKTPGNRNESYRKRLKISQTQNRRTVEKQEKNPEKNSNLGDMYEHVPSDSEQFDDQVVDAASKEESKEQNSDRLQMGDDEVEEGEEENMAMDETEQEDMSVEEVPENPAVAIKSKKDQTAQKKETANKTSQQKGVLDVPGEVVPTLGALAENTTFYGSQIALLESIVPDSIDVEALRKELVQEMSTWSGRHFDSVEHEHLAMSLWRKYEAITQSLSHELCEQLRLVLEPTKKSKLRGDYRTGKRLNMRKVVAYVASDFRKDKIWLRRTLPSQRQYQILIAVDDSSSMADNQTKELAFESLAVLSNALTVLEVGELSICSFGQSVELLHPFQVPFSSSDGARVLTKFSFTQTKTNIAELIALVTGVFDESRSRLLNVTNVSQLLLIVSDGRGIFREGVEVVKQAVRRLVNMGVFTVFVILDNPSESHNQGSILDIRVPIFGGPGQSLELRNYMQDFPFPFYLVLRNVKELPSTLCDALRQWFEMISSRD